MPLQLVLHQDVLVHLHTMVHQEKRAAGHAVRGPPALLTTTLAP